MCMLVRVRQAKKFIFEGITVIKLFFSIRLLFLKKILTTPLKQKFSFLKTPLLDIFVHEKQYHEESFLYCVSISANEVVSLGVCN